MTDNAHLTAAALRAATTAQHQRELQESFVRGFTMGHLAGFSAAAELAEGALEVGEEHGRESRDPDVDDAYRAGVAAAPDYHTGYRAGLEDAAAVISDLKARLARYEASRVASVADTQSNDEEVHGAHEPGGTARTN